MAVDTCTCNCKWNLNTFLSWRAYKKHKESNAGISCLAMVQTVVFVRLLRCVFVDMHCCLLCLLPEVDNCVITRVQNLTKISDCWFNLVSDKQIFILSVLTMCF